ncbi:MAG: hypothetical protein ACYTG0_12610 [Planctomycetota bacterium]|jgi:hypothetical protein
MACPCTMAQPPRPPVQLPLNAIVGTALGFATGALAGGSLGRYALGGALVGLAASLYNAWAFARYTEQVVASGAVVRT